MTASFTRFRLSVSALIACALLAALAVLGSTTPAAAHDQLVSTDPAADATVDALPEQITLGFNTEPLSGGTHEVQVTDASGTTLSDGPAVVDGTFVSQSLTGDASGPVTVLWRVVSSDGHPISGEFTFTVAGASSPPPTATPTQAPSPAASESSAPSASPAADETQAPVDSTAESDPSPLPWIVVGILLAAAAAVLVYLMIRRGKADAADGSGTGTER